MEKEENKIPKQGIDGCTFYIELDYVRLPLAIDIILRNPRGQEYGNIKQIGIDYVMFVCPPKYIRDWDKKESARAYMRTQVKHLLRKYKYPPEKAKGAVDIVIRQAELMSSNILPG